MVYKERIQKLAAAGKLKLSAHYTHLKDAGGVKRARTEVVVALRTDEFTHVCRSGAKSYYASIRQGFYSSNSPSYHCPQTC